MADPGGHQGRPYILIDSKAVTMARRNADAGEVHMTSHQPTPTYHQIAKALFQ